MTWDVGSVSGYTEESAAGKPKCAAYSRSHTPELALEGSRARSGGGSRQARCTRRKYGSEPGARKYGMQMANTDHSRMKTWALNPGRRSSEVGGGEARGRKVVQETRLKPRVQVSVYVMRAQQEVADAHRSGVVNKRFTVDAGKADDRGEGSGFGSCRLRREG